MNLPRIEALDLRSEPAKNADEFVWDWPIFPPRVAAFARMSNHSVAVHAEHVGSAHMYYLVDEDELWANTLMDGLQGGALIWRPWSRWNMPDNWHIYCLAIGTSVLVGLLIGGYPWR